MGDEFDDDDCIDDEADDCIDNDDWFDGEFAVSDEIAGCMGTPKALTTADKPVSESPVLLVHFRPCSRLIVALAGILPASMKSTAQNDLLLG